MIIVVLEEQTVWYFFDNILATSTNPLQLARHNKMDAKERNIIMEGAKYVDLCSLGGTPTTPRVLGLGGVDPQN